MYCFFTSFMRYFFSRFALPAAIVCLTACSGFQTSTHRIADALTVYRPEVVQGNVVTREQVAMLRTGMTRLQVRDILGTPLVSDLFHADRWDYVFTISRRGVEAQRYHLEIIFEGDALKSFEGDTMPTEKEFVAAISETKEKPEIPVLKATPEQLKKFDAESVESSLPQVVSPPVDAAPENIDYPPLEE